MVAGSEIDNKGRVFVIFGKKEGWIEIFDKSSLDGINGFIINGENTDDKFGI